jgi:hypothetical protein
MNALSVDIQVQQSLFSRGPVRGAVIRVTVAIGPISSNPVLDNFPIPEPPLTKYLPYF